MSTHTVAHNARELVLRDLDLHAGRIEARRDVFWQKLRAAGTEIWLDTGDLDEAGRIWSAEMTALTTNNHLLNHEIQKGIYDSFIKEANGFLKELPIAERIIEIAFILNARHGLRLVQRFGGKVSVELHTNLADDLEGIVAYGKRFSEISPDHFIVKVPLTATGLLGARRLREAGVPINFTLEFSARQNAIVTAVAKPNYVNVFLGRLNSYVSENGLGDGRMVGEKATISSQRIVKKLGARNPAPTKQIAASLRGADQLEALAGVDVFTIPTKVAEEGRSKLTGDFRSRLAEEYGVQLAAGVNNDDVHVEKLWEVPDQLVELAKSLDADPPRDGKGVVERARAAGCADLFPAMTPAELATITADGKIPKHAKWAGRVRAGTAAIDSLLNLAGLASFAQDQAALDGRIKGLIA